MSAPSTTPDTALKISALAELSGVSKELIHHYLREGLLPRPRDRARYDTIHLRLLRLIKRLREERFLPLAVIREIVTFNGFDPDQIELVLLSAPQNSTGLELPDGIAMSAEELQRRAGVTAARLDEYVRLGLVRPSGSSPNAHYHPHDLNIVSLLQRGSQMGIPLDSFRTIRSYVEVAFELEQHLFLPRELAQRDLGDLAREFATRKDVVTGFVVNVLNGLVNGLLYGFLDDAVQRSQSFDESVHRPSEAFVRKHGLDGDIERLRKQLARKSRGVATAERLVRLYVSCGRYREAVFVADQALARWPDARSVARLRGRALTLHGEIDLAVEWLESLDDGHALTFAYLASASFARVGKAGDVESTLRRAQRVVQLATEALDAARAGEVRERVEAQLIAGFVLTSLTGARHLQEQGLEALEDAFAATEALAPDPIEPEVFRLQARITAAYLLHRSSTLWRPTEGDPRLRSEALRLEVFSIDPACDLAERLFLSSPRAP